MDKLQKISVVIPVYYGENSIEELSQQLIETIVKKNADYEIIFVDDYSPDGSWNVIKKMHNANPKIHGLNFSRNFGQHYAISAGLANATGDWVVVMDCDLQDAPEEIEKLYKSSRWVRCGFGKT